MAQPEADQVALAVGFGPVDETAAHFPQQAIDAVRIENHLSFVKRRARRKTLG